MHFRAFTPADTDACLAVFDSNAEHFFSPGDREEFAAFLAKPVGNYGVLCNDETLVGRGGLAPSKDDLACAVLTWGMVHARHHGKGWGRVLLEMRLRWLREMPGVEKVTLHTSHETAGFSRKLGFRETAFLRDGYRAGLHRCDMELVVGERGR